MSLYRSDVINLLVISPKNMGYEQIGFQQLMEAQKNVLQSIKILLEMTKERARG